MTAADLEEIKKIIADADPDTAEILTEIVKEIERR